MKYVKRGFTLVELLLVIAIIGVLTIIVIANVNNSRIKARDSKRLQDVRQLKLALELYYETNKAYPTAGLPAGTGGTVSNLNSALVPAYISSIALDPPYYREYVWGPSNAYGIYVYQERTGMYCVTGVNVNSAWWSGPPACKF